MTESSFRMIPVLETNGKVSGVVSGMDVIDYLGGGKKHDLILKRDIHLLYEALKLPASNIMTSNPLTVDISTKLEEVLELMINYGVGAVPVVSKGMLIGIVSELEIMKYLAGKQVRVKVREVMTNDVITADLDSTLERVMRLMVRAGIRRVPIVNGDLLAGVVSWKNIIGLIGSHKVFEALRSETIDELRALPVKQVISTDIVKVSPNIDIGVAAESMISGGEGYALVIEEDELRGIVTARDIVFGIVVG